MRIARQATSKYNDVTVALADGFVPVSECVSEGHETGDPTDTAAMGIHFFNLDRYDSHRDGRYKGVIELTRPELLIYVPDALAPGGLRLVVIEYATPITVDGEPWTGAEEPDPNRIDNPPPQLFGREFDGPMRGHVRAPSAGPVDPEIDVQEWHYDLHVWAWSHNPRGLFEHYNPNEDCVP